MDLNTIVLIAYGCIALGTCESVFSIMGDISDPQKPILPIRILAAFWVGLIWPVTITSMIVRKLLIGSGL